VRRDALRPEIAGLEHVVVDGDDPRYVNRLKAHGIII
jgi:hypothetical protein